MTPQPRHSLKQGFTVIELATVIVIVGILSAMAAPRFANKNSYNGVFFYNTAISSLRYAQKLAMYSGCRVQVSISGSTLTLLQAASCTSGGFTTNVRDPSSGSISYVQTAPSGVSVAASDANLYFDSSGICYRSSNGSIANYTVTIGGKVINIIGQTGYAYDPST